MKAATEFQKILDHRGVDPVSPLYPLAHLGLGRAYALLEVSCQDLTRHSGNVIVLLCRPASESV
jgi:hypothetical protein